MPPGSYRFWRFGMVSPRIRWAFTLGVCCALIMAWYLLSTRFLFKQSSDQLWCAQCTAQLAELALSSDEVILPINQSNEQALFIMLNACEKGGLSVQSSTSLKPTKKNNLTMQRINIIGTGSLEQIKLFLDQLVDGAVAFSHLEIHIAKQQDKLYTVTLSLESIGL